MQTNNDRSLQNYQTLFLNNNDFRLVDGSLEAEGQGQTEATEAEQISLLLEAWNLTISEGKVQSQDGSNLKSVNSDALLDFGDAPPLPSVTGPQASPDQVAQELAAWFDGSMMGAALEWEILLESVNQLRQESHDNRSMRNVMFKVKTTARLQAIRSDEARIDGERDAISEQLTYAIVAAVVAFAIAALGSVISHLSAPAKGVDATAGQAAWGAVGAGLGASAMALGQLVNTLGQYESKNHGGQKEADEKQLLKQRQDWIAEVWGNLEEEFRASHDETKKQHDNFLQTLVAIAERRTQALQAIARA